MTRISSALCALDIRQEPAPLIIGERLNTQGSKVAKRLVLDDDIDGLVQLARDQVDDGAHCIDVCVDTTERSDEKDLMLRLVKQLSLEVDAPLVIDSTSADVVSAVVERIPGMPLINSINLEGDGSRFSTLAPVMAKYGTPAVAMCIGPDGMAKTTQQKIDTAKLLYSKGKEYGLHAGQFVFDVLTFTLGTGDAEYERAGVETLEGIRRVHEEMPDSFTVLGLSNISFGLAPRVRSLINSVFMYHAVRAGLDAVIVNIRSVMPYAQISRTDKELAESLIFNTSDNALNELSELYDESAPSSSQATRKDDMPSGASARCTYKIINRIRETLEDDVVTAIRDKIPDGAQDTQSVHDAAIETLNADLLPAMKTVGDRFGAGEIILPFVLRSAECMKAAVAKLEEHLIKSEDTSKAKIVLGTVYGDVHDIGKNLVKTILENNGYAVYDLGKQVPLQRFVEEIRKTGADAVGLSALLVNTSRQMTEFIDHARKNDLGIPILCGGAAIHSNFVNRIAKEGGIYEHGVFYCNTMFDGLDIMEKISAGQRDSLVSEWRKKLEAWKEPEAPQRRSDVKPRTITPQRPPKSPRLGTLNRLDDVRLEDIWQYVDKRSLFKMSWGVRGRAAKAAESEHEQLYDTWKARAVDESILEPQVVYGYFACRNAGNGTLSVKAGSRDIEFAFPVYHGASIADYFGDDDIVAFQAVSMGTRAAEIIEGWNKTDAYTDAYYLHGLAVEATEALAAWAHERIRGELGIGSRGLRYSWGYPSCPDLSQHKLVWDLIDPASSGMTLTSEYQIVPEYSTAAIIVHHADAAY